MDNRSVFMRKLALSFTTSCLVLTSLAASGSSTLDSMNSLTPAPANKTVLPGQTMLIPNAPATTAAAFVLMDADSGKIIAGNNMDTHLAPASLTKLMTLYVVSNALKNGQIHLKDEVRVSQKAWQTGGSRMFIQVNTLVTVEDLLKGVIVDSGNDASVALAEYVAGSEDAFANLMNQEAQRLGMKNSHFTDCNGLPDPNHYSSAHDLAILARHLINDFPEYYKWYADKTFTYNNITQSNRNRLLWRFPYADGLKTGHTDDAGFCLVASAKKDGQRLVSVVMKEPSDNARADDSISLLTYGFNFFKTYKLYSAGETITDARIWDGKEKHVAAGVLQNVYITLPIGQYEKLKAESQLDSPIHAPIAKGQSIGHLALTLNDKTMMQIPLVALQDNPRGNFWERMIDRISMSINRLLHKSKTEIASMADKVTDEVSSVADDAKNEVSSATNKATTELKNAPTVQPAAEKPAN